ncbi:MAG: metallophosphoesterase family protein [Rhodoferax sp.]|nr:metallophosphoesterase family protein [Rhodoferax sp.]
MKLALLSDVHSNLHALQACLSHARGHGAQQFAFLGDLVGYGAQPAEVLDCIMALEAEGAWVLRGNHEELALAPPGAVQQMGDIGAAWTSQQLSPAQRSWLAALPLTRALETVLLVHASVNDPARWRYVDSPQAATASLDAAREWPQARYVFGGHVHAQTLYYRGAVGQLMPFQPQAGVAIPVPRHRHWLATVGSVGQPRDGNPQAMYALFDRDAALLTFHRVHYDHAAAADAIRRAGLPEFFASRLELGR